MAVMKIPVIKDEYSAKTMNFPMEGFSFVGLIAMMDPPKPGVLEAVEDCRTAGIKVYMLTGDHPVTAESIARQVGIIKFGKTIEDLALE
jgi:sodium/potassium-transporting ATPase subunit alpha